MAYKCHSRVSDRDIHIHLCARVRQLYCCWYYYYYYSFPWHTICKYHIRNCLSSQAAINYTKNTFTQRTTLCGIVHLMIVGLQFVRDRISNIYNCHLHTCAHTQNIVYMVFDRLHAHNVYVQNVAFHLLHFPPVSRLLLLLLLLALHCRKWFTKIIIISHGIATFRRWFYTHCMHPLCCCVQCAHTKIYRLKYIAFASYTLAGNLVAIIKWNATHTIIRCAGTYMVRR